MEIKANEIKIVDIDSLIPNPKNNNKHSTEQIERLTKLIKYQGFRNPVVVSNRTGFLVVGHGRIEAAKLAGLDKVPAIFQDFDTEAQEYAYLTSDNEIARWAEFDKDQFDIDLKDLGLDEDFDLDLFGLPELDIPVEVLDSEGEDDVPEVQPDPIAKRGDVWILGNHRLMCGDSTMIDDVEKLMDGNKADMVFTDPPYGVDYDGGHATEKRREKLANDDDVNMYDLPIKNAYAASTDKAAFYIWFSDSKAVETVQGVEDSGLSIRSWIIWNKNVAQFGAIGAQYKMKHEPCLYAFKKGKSPNWCGPNNEVTVWDIARDHKNSHHPTQKPVALSERAFQNHSIGKVLDVFGGSGSTLISCEKNNKTSYTMELSEQYCDVIIKRWQEYTDKEATLETTGETYNSMVPNED